MTVQGDEDLLTTAEAAQLAGVSPRTLIRWRDREQRLQSYPVRHAVVEARPGIGWKREEVLRAAGKPTTAEVSDPNRPLTNKKERLSYG